MDWVKWHENYEASPALKARLVFVREHLARCFDESNFMEVCIDNTPDDAFTIGSHRYKGTGQVLQQGIKLFEFTGYDQMYQDSVCDSI